MTTKEYTNDSPEGIAKGAVKYDGGKAPIYRGAISYFPRAISAVAAVSAFGASKYAWNGWRSVPNGFERYSDALVRHLTNEGSGEILDPDSGSLHAAHIAWNALARLELLLETLEPKKEHNENNSENKTVADAFYRGTDGGVERPGVPSQLPSVYPEGGYRY